MYPKLEDMLNSIRLATKEPIKKGYMSFKGTAKEFGEYLEELKGAYTNEN